MGRLRHLAVSGALLAVTAGAHAVVIRDDVPAAGHPLDPAASRASVGSWLTGETECSAAGVASAESDGAAAPAAHCLGAILGELGPAGDIDSRGGAYASLQIAPDPDFDDTSDPDLAALQLSGADDAAAAPSSDGLLTPGDGQEGSDYLTAALYGEEQALVRAPEPSRMAALATGILLLAALVALRAKHGR